MTASIAYREHLVRILKTGSPSCPRGMPILEIIGAKSLVSMEDPVIRNVGRGASYQLMIDEARWILAGSDALDFSPKIKEIWEPYSDDGKTLAGAYGPMFVGQAAFVAHVLTRDKDSRQAVMTIWRSCPEDSKNIPCTVSLQWLIRNNKIHCVANMRSSDAWRGWPYDVFCFSMMTWEINMQLDRQWGMGVLHLNMGSAHIYRENIEQATKISQSAVGLSWPFPYLNHDLNSTKCLSI